MRDIKMFYIFYQERYNVFFFKGGKVNDSKSKKFWADEVENQEAVIAIDSDIF